MEKVYASIRVLIVQDDKVLIIHRLNHGEEYWVFPGGHVEVGESVESAARREVLEETSLKVTEISQTIPYLHPKNNEPQAVVVAQVEPGEPKLGNGNEVFTKEDQYIPQWLDLKSALMLTNIVPEPAFKIFYDLCRPQSVA